MNCPNCHKQIPDSTKFCTYCGSRVRNDEPVLKEIRCAGCGASFEIKEGYRYVVCPYCGIHHQVNESDAVIVERMRTQAQRDIARDRIELERETLNAKLEDERKKEENTKKEAYNNGILVRLEIIFGIISIAETIIAFLTSRIVAGIVSSFQIVFLFFSLLIGFRAINTRKRWFHVFLCVLSMVLSCLWMCLYDGRFADYVA